MPGCSVHSYLIVPALSGVQLYVPSLPNVLELNDAPLSALTSWGTDSSLCQVIFWPTGTWTFSGLKRKDFISIGAPG